MKTLQKVSFFVSLSLALVSSAFYGSAFAGNAIPDCLDEKGALLPLDNARVLELKKTGALGKTIRARAAGKVTRAFPSRGKSGQTHTHFEITLDGTPEGVLEVIYNEGFGEMPQPAIGSYAEACGDFINAYATQNGYPPSPSKAIIHWVHRSNNEVKHAHGYVVLDQVLYGFGFDRRPGRGGRDR